jgi:5'-nucleotidase
MNSRKRLLLTNDDGFDAPGIWAMEQAARELGALQVIAPASHQSGCGHQVTTHGPLEIFEKEGGHFSVEGTPADCVRLAHTSLTGPIDWILSGINLGGNLGLDTYHSGTVAAVREGVIHGIPGIAVSHYKKPALEINWDQAARWTARVLADLIQRPIPPETFWNVNLPHLEDVVDMPEMVFCQVDPSPLPVEYKIEGNKAIYMGRYDTRKRRPGWDVDVCFGGKIAISLVRLVTSEPGLI